VSIRAFSGRLRLPEQERAAFIAFWAEVNALDLARSE
jgi:hypothetical protein